MKDPRNWSWLIVLMAIATGLALTSLSCANDDDDDDDEEPTSYGTDIEGSYIALMTTTMDTCKPEDVGENEEWLFEIEQNDTFSTATVYKSKIGAGAEQEEMFRAEVFGTSIVLLETEKIPIGDTDCIKVQLKHYRLTISGENEEKTEISGRLYDEIFYLGDECDSSTVECKVERIVEPIDGNADDDTLPDDDTGDDDTNETLTFW